MQVWMIALIVIACVVAFFALLVFGGALLAVNIVLGRRSREASNMFSDKYGIDLGWFDEVKDKTETIEIVAYDGIKLRALHIKHEDGAHRVAVLQHGYCASPRAMQPYAKILFDKGYDIVMPSARAHGMSEGKYIGMAWLDRFDLSRWVKRVIELYGESVKIAVMGVSMGGATVVALAGMQPPPQVKCVIDDCGFSSQREIFYSCVRKAPLPKRLCVMPLALGIRLKCGYSYLDADIVPFAQKMDIPALFIHGTADAFVPCEHGKKLYEACGSSDKSIYLVEGAEHVAAYSHDKEEYKKRLSEFIDRTVGE